MQGLSFFRAGNPAPLLKGLPRHTDGVIRVIYGSAGNFIDDVFRCGIEDFERLTLALNFSSADPLVFHASLPASNHNAVVGSFHFLIARFPKGTPAHRPSRTAPGNAISPVLE